MNFNEFVGFHGENFTIYCNVLRKIFYWDFLKIFKKTSFFLKLINLIFLKMGKF